MGDMLLFTAPQPSEKVMVGTDARGVTGFKSAQNRVKGNPAKFIDPVIDTHGWIC
ncbi:hypothetical protein GCM10011409_33480 [Lentibacillus populi]|uniref:Uncharacterized protein n=1 Tax=Lentibacillus populi TaxID=1827502 RepID=A0A9W5U0E3_9BACI|nr:hypothetical protein GCM10011409_33480 [Lentibacillus populi]